MVQFYVGSSGSHQQTLKKRLSTPGGSGHPAIIPVFPRSQVKKCRDSITFPQMDDKFSSLDGSVWLFALCEFINDEMWEEIALFDPTKYPRKDAVEG